MKKRKGRVRRSLKHNSDRIRLSVTRSNVHIYAQLIDDVSGKTLASASTLDKDLKGKGNNKKEQAVLVGTLIAKRAVEAGVSKVVFDRGPYLYHGRVAALADAAREAGLDF